ncbi:MAG TPA: IS1380 family transposase [Actinomycetes bacterium]|nr:IS1380 family transposase [Actinomycetes bacterium]
MPVPPAAAGPSFAFGTPTGFAISARFDAGALTSDGGLPWLGLADRALGLCDAFARCVPDWRRGPVRHSLEALVRQRVYQIACGYADQDDADALRSDPLLKLACGRLPASGPDLASQPTLSRLENAVDRHAVEALAEALADLYVRERGRAGPPRQLLLDLDGTADPAHGRQEGVAYHGYFRQHIYHPLLVFDGDTGHLITAVLRPGDVHGSRFAVLVLRRLLKKLRAAWPEVAVELRADSGFATPRLYAWCEANAVGYTIGLIPNAVLEAAAAPLLAAAQAQSRALEGAKVRLAGATSYRAKSWPRPRRVVFKAEALAKGPNTRFVVTTRAEDPLAVYDRYVDRGEPENWIKDFKRALQADRLSDHRFWANAFRLLLHAAAYWLLDHLRCWLVAAAAARLQLDTLRLRVIKIGGWVREVADRYGPRLCLHLGSHHPGQHLWPLLVRATRSRSSGP